MIVLALFGGCYQLDGFFFNPTVVEAYSLGGDVVPSSCQELVSFEGRAGTLYGAWAHSPIGTATTCTEADAEVEMDPQAPVVVYFHGNAANIDAYWDQVEFYWESGYEVFIFDYRGYGRSWGDPDFDGVIADGRTAIEYVEDRSGLASTELVYIGLSLGGFVSVHNLAVTPPKILITQDMFASSQKMLDDGTDLDLPAGWFFTENFDNARTVSTMPEDIPYLITHGTEDDYIQPEHAELVYDAAAATTKELFWVDGVGHADAVADAPDLLRPKIECWIRQDCAEE